MASIPTLDQKVVPDRIIPRTALCKLFTFEQIRIVCSQKRDNNYCAGTDPVGGQSVQWRCYVEDQTFALVALRLITGFPRWSEFVCAGIGRGS
jgi:hypothetical protein